MLTFSDGANNPAPPLLFQSDFPEEEELRLTLNNLSAELLKLDDIHWICPLMQCSEEVRVITGRSVLNRPVGEGGKFWECIDLSHCLLSRTLCGAAVKAPAA